MSIVPQPAEMPRVGWAEAAPSRSHPTAARGRGFRGGKELGPSLKLVGFSLLLLLSPLDLS